MPIFLIPTFKKFLAKAIAFLPLGLSSMVLGTLAVWPLARGGVGYGAGDLTMMICMALYIMGENWPVALARPLIFNSVLAGAAALTWQFPVAMGDLSQIGDRVLLWRVVWGVFFGGIAVALWFTGKFLMRRAPGADTQALERLELEFPSLKGYAAAFERELGPWLAGEETARHKAFSNAQTYTLLAGMAAGLVLFITQMTGATAYDFWIVVAGAAAMIKCRNIANLPLQVEVREKVSRHIANWLGLEYGRELEDFNLQGFAIMNLIQPFTRKAVEEIFSGHHEGVSFQVTKARLSSVRKYYYKGQERETVTHVFEGSLIAIFVPFTYAGITKVLPDLGAFNNAAMRSGMKEQRINLGLLQVERKFEVYGTDQIESRAILSPDVLEGALKISGNVSPKAKLGMAFVDNMVLIAVNDMGTGGLKFTSLEASFSDRAAISRLVEKMALVNRMIDLLCLPRKAALRE